MTKLTKSTYGDELVTAGFHRAKVTETCSAINKNGNIYLRWSFKVPSGGSIELVNTLLKISDNQGNSVTGKAFKTWQTLANYISNVMNYKVTIDMLQRKKFNKEDLLGKTCILRIEKVPHYQDSNTMVTKVTGLYPNSCSTKQKLHSDFEQEEKDKDSSISTEENIESKGPEKELYGKDSADDNWARYMITDLNNSWKYPRYQLVIREYEDLI